MGTKRSIGIVGTGFIAKGLVVFLEQMNDFVVSSVLTRRKLDQCPEFPRPDLLTNRVDQLIENAECVVVSTGDVIYGTDVIDQVMTSGIPVVTLDAELQVTTGSYFARKGFITEAEGDQPGCLAALHENVLHMGFKPLVYGNIKGFLNETPSLEDMKFWSKKNGISLKMVTSFTDGTKVHMEQALVANGLGASIHPEGIQGPSAENVYDGGSELAYKAQQLNLPISDYLLSPKSPPGVFITCTHDDRQREALRYLKQGDGPFYTLLQNHHLCHLEIVKTLRRVFREETVLLNNSNTPKISVAAVAKENLQPGEKIKEGIGGFQVRGSAVRINEYADHIPIGLLQKATIKNVIPAGRTLTFDDVELLDSLALRAWMETKERIFKS